MQNDLISRSALKERWTIASPEPYNTDAAEVLASIEDAPVVDAVEVVRCKDCERIKQGRFDIFELAYCDLWKTDMQMDNYCCFGNRRADDDRQRKAD